MAAIHRSSEYVDVDGVNGGMELEKQYTFGLAFVNIVDCEWAENVHGRNHETIGQANINHLRKYRNRNEAHTTL